MSGRVLIGYSRCPITVGILRERGVEAYTCDLRPADHPWHIQADIRAVAGQRWDWAIFHPMCTYLTCSAAWAFADPDYSRYPGVGYHQAVTPETLTGAARRAARAEALANFQWLLSLPYPKAIENPAPSFVSKSIRPPDQTIQPYEFGDDASKRTGLWLDRLPILTGTRRRSGRLVEWPRGSRRLVERWGNQTDAGQNRLSPSADRWLDRSATYPGIAAAMAVQWCAVAQMELDLT